ncbi:MAG: HAD family phosphatase [Defluviitaleaceae bacterium]|nr:HAD family phosphatase [Defluviitaleaceae bacterium]
MKAYIFDLDGTLLESMDIWGKVNNGFFNKRGMSCPDNYYEAIAATYIDEAAIYTKNQFGLKESPEDIKKEWLTMAAQAYSNEVQLKPYAKDYLTRLSKEGKKLAVATSLPTELLEPALHNHEIYNIFHAICTAREVGCGKSKPDVFLLAAKKLGVAPEDCLLFDDILAAVKSAKSIGMKVCGVYDKSSAHDWEEIKQTADYTIIDFSNPPH